MAKFVQIGSEIINLDLVARVERGDVVDHKPTVIVYFVGDTEQTHSRYTDEQAEAVWQKFLSLSQTWNIAGTGAEMTAVPGRVADQT